MSALADLLRGDKTAERTVPPTGYTALLTLVSAAAMAFLAVFVLAIALSAGRQASEWESSLQNTGTVRVSAEQDMLQSQVEAVELILSQTPGIGSTRRVTDAEQAALLEPWFFRPAMTKSGTRPGRSGRTSS